MSDAEFGDVALPGGVPTARRASVVGLLGVGSLPGLLFCGLGVPMAIAALALAPAARRQVEASGGRLGGLGIVRAARICSVISLVLGIVVGVALVAAFAFLIDSSGGNAEPGSARAWPRFVSTSALC